MLPEMIFFMLSPFDMTSSYHESTFKETGFLNFIKKDARMLFLASHHVF